MAGLTANGTNTRQLIIVWLSALTGGQVCHSQKVAPIGQISRIP